MAKKSKIKLTPFDPAKYLDSPEAIATYLSEALKTEDAEFIALAIGDVAKAKGMAAIAKETGLARESLYKAFDGRTAAGFDTVRKVLSALGVRLVVEAA
jgi:probable addiction module antidote protein